MRLYRGAWKWLRNTSTLRDVDQHLARYIAAVEEGREFVITRDGEPVWLGSSAQRPARPLSEEQLAALKRTRERMRNGLFDLGRERVNREDIYDRHGR